MTTQTWFRWSLLLPVALPLLLLPLLLMGGQGFDSLVWIVGLPLIFGGVPYLPFAVGLACALGRTGPSRAVKLVWLSPLAFAMTEALFVAAALLAGNASWAQWWMLPSLLAAFALVYGYGYVVVATGVYVVLKASGIIVDEPPGVRPRVVRWGPGEPRPERYRRLAAPQPRGSGMGKGNDSSQPATLLADPRIGPLRA